MAVSNSGRPPKNGANVYTAIQEIVRAYNTNTEPVTANIVSATLQAAGTPAPPRSARRMLHKMGMRYIRGQARVYLAEKNVTVSFRAKCNVAHKMTIRGENGNPTIPQAFLDETYCIVNHTSAMSQHQRGRDDEAYHGNFTAELFERWLSKPCATLADQCGPTRIHMDSAAYHKRITNPVPATKSTKANIQQRLRENVTVLRLYLFENPPRRTVKAELLETFAVNRPTPKLPYNGDRGRTRTHGPLRPAIPPKASAYQADLGSAEAGDCKLPSRLDAATWREYPRGNGCNDLVNAYRHVQKK
ncbi:hypothetical protein PybrP1_012144 [[Pythium] brassicae (nom. inval.)]|nr:hypothetical protein PybrP1_012144 [[Pythium] brassicae (nom. inval.)]